MRAANIVALVAIALWAGLLWVGVDLLKGVVSQHVPNYPAPGQFDFLVRVPLAVIVAVSGITLVANGLKRFWWASLLVGGAALLGLLPYLMMYGGGV